MGTQERGQSYLANVQAKVASVEKHQAENFRKAGAMIADAYAEDRLIHVYAGGGHTCLMICEMFFRAGGFANVNPIMGHDISPFCQALKYLEVERTPGYANCLIRYYGVSEGDLLILFHNIGMNPTTIDAASKPAAVAIASSPAEETSAPAPARIATPQSASEGFAFSANSTCTRSPKAPRTAAIRPRKALAS